MVQTDALLMVGVRNGQMELFDELLRRYRHPVIGFLCRMTGDRNAAEDLAQEVFLRVYRSRLGYEPTAKFATWIYRIAMNLALNWRRDRGNERKAVCGWDLDTPEHAWSLADGHPGIDAELVRRANALSIRQAIDELPSRQRAVVLMHHYHELSYAEMARVLECSPQAIKSLVFRAYSTLRQRLACAEA